VNFIRKRNISLGVSLDGPAELHDKYRVDRNQKPTFLKVMSGINTLKAAGLPLDIICVVTRETITKPTLLFEFFESIGANSVSFNIDEANGVNKHSSHHVNDTHLFSDFLIKYFELIAKSETQQRVRELENGINYVFSKSISPSWETVPLQVVSVACNGDFSTFSPELLNINDVVFNNFIFGNVHDDMAVQKLTHNRMFNDVWVSIQRGIDLCRSSCSYFFICKGGIPANKFGQHGTFEVAETTACVFKKKAVVDAFISILSKEI
jgi:uncharacterized protein